MARKSKKEKVYNNDCCEEDVVENVVETSPDVVLQIKDEVKPTQQETNNQTFVEDTKIKYKDIKTLLFEQSNKKVKIINKILPRKNEVKRIKSIQVNLNQKVPLMSKFKGSKGRKSNTTFSFKIGGKN